MGCATSAKEEKKRQARSKLRIILEEIIKTMLP
jgi:hypothetical protein